MNTLSTRSIFGSQLHSILWKITEAKHTHTHLLTHTLAHTHARIHTHTHTHTRARVCTRPRIYMHVRTHRTRIIHTRAQTSLTHKHTYTHMQTHAQTTQTHTQHPHLPQSMQRRASISMFKEIYSSNFGSSKVHPETLLAS